LELKEAGKDSAVCLGLETGERYWKTLKVLGRGSLPENATFEKNASVGKQVEGSPKFEFSK